MDRTSIRLDKLQKLVQEIAPGSAVLRAWPLRGGISAEMTAFEIQNLDGQIRRVILRRPSAETLLHNPHAAEDEFKILRLTKSLGLAVPTPYYLDSTGDIFSTPSLVMEYIDGKPEFPSAPGARFTSKLAEHLAKIHSADLSNQDLSFVPKAGEECVELSRIPQTIVQSPLGVERIRDRLKKVSPLPQRNASILLHGDYWPGNILWRNDILVGIIDWEDAQIGDPLIDLAISRLDILWILGIDAMSSFTRHYQSVMDIDYENLPYWDLCAALRLARLVGTDLAKWIAFFVQFGRWDLTEDTLKEYFQFFIDRALDKLAG